MSAWIPVKSEDIDVDANNREVNLFVLQDYHGNVYATLTFLQIEELCEKIAERE